MAQWTQQQIDDLRGEYLKPRTTREFIDWWNANGNLILMMYAVKNENIGYRDERKFWPVAKINADWDSFNKEFKEYVTELEKTEIVDWISHPELSPFAAYWSEPDEQTGGWKYIDDEALRIDRKAGLLRQYHKIKVTKEAGNFPIVYKIAEAFDFDFVQIDVNYQPTGGVASTHLDYLTSIIQIAMDEDPEIGDIPYNFYTKMPDGYQAMRIVVALTPWFQGQGFLVEDMIWAGWEVGDAVAFDWINCIHATVNASYEPRVVMRLSGMVNERSEWVLDREPPRTFNIT